MQGTRENAIETTGLRTTVLVFARSSHGQPAGSPAHAKTGSANDQRQWLSSSS